jgi:hypothetical protein
VRVVYSHPHPVFWQPENLGRIFYIRRIQSSRLLKGYLGNWPQYYRVVRSKLMFSNVPGTNNFHQQHSHETEKFENHLQFRNIFLANVRTHAQFSKHSVSFMQFSGPCVIVTQSSQNAQCRLDLHLFQAGKFHGTYVSRATKATQWSAHSQSGR